MKVFIVNGSPGVGKSSFEGFARDIIGEEKVVIYSTIDYVKEVAKFCGWNGEKDLESRAFLSEMKRALTLWRDIPVQKTLEVARKASEEGKVAMFVDCREPQEIHRLCKILEGTAVIVRKTDFNPETSNYSDMAVNDAVYDVEIWNDGDLHDLKVATLEFCKEFGLVG